MANNNELSDAPQRSETEKPEDRRLRLEISRIGEEAIIAAGYDPETVTPEQMIEIRAERGAGNRNRSLE